MGKFKWEFGFSFYIFSCTKLKTRLSLVAIFALVLIACSNSVKKQDYSAEIIKQFGPIERSVNVSRDLLGGDFWQEVEKNEVVKICLDDRVHKWKTSLKSAIFNDSCLVLQAPTLIGVDTLNVYFSDSDSSHRINLAVGMKYLNFNSEEVLIGYDQFNKSELRTLGLAKNQEPERLVSVTAKYLIDKYPVTNCEFLQLMWDSIPEKGVYYENFYSIEKARKKWISRKKTSIHHENCAAHDSATSTISWYQAMKYANARSTREGLKPYYTFSVINEIPNCSRDLDGDLVDETNCFSEKILSNGYIVGYWDFTRHKEWYIQATIDSTSDGYRLPYIEEWSMFARGGDKKNKAPWGDSSATQEEVAKYAQCSSEEGDYYTTAPVGQLLPNGYGLYDMFGIVSERVLLKDYMAFNFDFPTALKGYGCRNTANYGSFETGDEGVLSGFRLIRNIGNNAKWVEVRSDKE